MEVFAFGMSRSGTDSLARALRMLGYTPYHGHNTLEDHRDSMLWLEALESKYRNKGHVWTRVDYDRILGDYDVSRI